MGNRGASVGPKIIISGIFLHALITCLKILRKLNIENYF